MKWPQKVIEPIAKCVTFNNYILYLHGICLLSYHFSPFLCFFFFPFVKRILVIEITTRFCFCFDSIKVSDKFKWRNLFIKSPFSSLWIDNLFCDWILEISCQEKVHWRTLYGQFNCLFICWKPYPFFFPVIFYYVYCCDVQPFFYQVVKANLYLPSGLT